VGGSERRPTRVPRFPELGFCRAQKKEKLFLMKATPSLMCYSVCIFLQKKSKRGNPALIGAGGNHFL